MDFLGPLCADSQPGFLGLFDFSIAPPLLYYSYVPIIIAATGIGIYIFIKDRRSLRSRLLFTMTLFFVLWVVNILVQWVGVHNSVIMFAWQLTAVFEVGIFLSAAYFAQTFLFNRDISFAEKLFVSAIAVATLVALPTEFNVLAYDIENCEGINGPLWTILYAFEPAVVVLMVWLGIDAYRKEKSTAVRKQIVIFTAGIASFLTTFFLSNFYGELTKVYEFNLWGPIGMVVFLVLLGYMIVRYHTFNVKLFATEVLVVGIAFLTGSRLFYSPTLDGLILSAVTLIAFLISGVFLIRSVKREIEQREHIEKLAQELEQTNERQEGLLHFIGHEVKGSLTKDEGAFAALMDGDFGALPESAKSFAANALAQARDGVRSVTDILTASNQKKGTVSYVKEPFDLRALIVGSIEKAQPMAQAKGLVLSLSVDEAGAPYSFTGDKEKIAESVLRNIIENSINYTPSGSIAVSLKRENGRIVCAVKDTGVGISDEDKKNLFTAGGHGKESQRVNVHSTGYGLFIAKNIVEVHGGTIRAESEGVGRGSTFVIEFPAPPAK